MACMLFNLGDQGVRRTLTVNLIPQTLALTNLKDLQVGDRVNVEIDQTTRTLVDTLHRVLRKV